MRNRRKYNQPSAKAEANLSRRALIQRAGWTAAALAVPTGLFAADAGVSPVMAKLSAYMAKRADERFPMKSSKRPSTIFSTHLRP